MNKNICILVDSLSGGGAEKAGANLSISLNKKGYTITIVSMQNNIDYKFGGELYNFGLVKKENSTFRAFLIFRDFFKINQFGYIIDHRTRYKFIKEWLFSKFIFKNQNVIYCIHSFDLNYYFSFLNLPLVSVYPHVKRREFVSVSKGIQKKLKQKLNITSELIYNYVNAHNLDVSLEEIKGIANKKYIIAVGRLDPVKQFDLLINCYNRSSLKKNNIELIILGSGPEKENLEACISKLNLENCIKIIPFKKDPFILIKDAKALVLSSKFEGFPMVLIEALFLKTPVISFNCKSGPSEIIKDRINGLLVENQNEEQLTLALNKLLLDETFYTKIKENTQYGLENFSEFKSIQKWINLLANHI
jgi:N-acetylgalactosamine-N,N'-diacetylbacillosaminyl-diphospho-undecaprenol 4-alpha-N-acetylgalactosaminyltransferase